MPRILPRPPDRAGSGTWPGLDSKGSPDRDTVVIRGAAGVTSQARSSHVSQLTTLLRSLGPAGAVANVRRAGGSQARGLGRRGPGPPHRCRCPAGGSAAAPASPSPAPRARSARRFRIAAAHHHARRRRRTRSPTARPGCCRRPAGRPRPRCGAGPAPGPRWSTSCPGPSPWRRRATGADEQAGHEGAAEARGRCGGSPEGSRRAESEPALEFQWGGGRLARWSTSAGPVARCSPSRCVIAAFEGWNDAGDAASTAARYLAERWDAELVAEIDPEEFTDFSTTRPAGAAGRRRPPRRSCGPPPRSWPPRSRAATATRCSCSATSRSSRWRTFCAQIVGVAEAYERPARHHARRAARRGAPHPAHPDRRHRLRARHGRGHRAAPVDLRGAHRHRRRAPRRGPLRRPAHRLAVGHGAVLRARRPVAEGGAGARRADRRHARHLGAHHRPRDRLRLLRAPGQRARRRRRGDRHLRRLARGAPRHRARRFPTAESIADEVERFLREHPPDAARSPGSAGGCQGCSRASSKRTPTGSPRMAAKAWAPHWPTPDGHRRAARPRRTSPTSRVSSGWRLRGRRRRPGRGTRASTAGCG